MLAPLSDLWDTAAESGLGHAPGHQPFWAFPVATPGRTVSARMRQPSCGALGCGVGVATVPAAQRRTPRPGLCVGRVGPVCYSGTVAGLGQRGRGQPPRGMGVGAAGRGPGDGHAPRGLTSGRDRTATP